MRYIGSITIAIVLTVVFIHSNRIHAEPPKELIFGVYPYLSPSEIIQQYTPLQNHLAEVLHQKVSLRSAPDFKTFMERTHAGEYDIIFTAPHMGRVAHRNDSYLPVVQSEQQIVVVILTQNHSPIQSIADLNQRSLAIGAQMSITYQITNQALKLHHLNLEQSVRFVPTASFSNVLEAVIRGEADAGATGTGLWDVAPAEQKRLLREIFRSDPVPGMFVLAHPRLGETVLKPLQSTFMSYSATVSGQEIRSKNRFFDFRPLDEMTLRAMDPYTELFEQP